MADNNNDTITMSIPVLNKLVNLNRKARDAVSAVGGNSVQEGYRNNTFAALDEQYQLLEVFVSE